MHITQICLASYYAESGPESSKSTEWGNYILPSEIMYMLEPEPMVVFCGYCHKAVTGIKE